MRGDVWRFIQLNDLHGYQTTYPRIKALEGENRRHHAHRGEGPPVRGGGGGLVEVPIVDINEVTATVVPAYDSSHNFRPYIHINVGGTYATTRSFVCYELRVFPAIGAAFEHVGPEYPLVASPIDIHNLPTPPQNTETWHVQVRVRTSLYGTGFWSDLVPITWGGDTVAPLTPVWPAGSAWLLDNSYNWGAHESSVSVTCQPGTPVDQDLNAFIFSVSLDGGATWNDLPPVIWTAPIGTFRHLAPGASIQIRVSAEDTSGNRSVPSVVKTLTVANVSGPPAPGSWAIGTYDFDEVTRNIILPFSWTAPPGYTGQLSGYRLYLTSRGFTQAVNLGLLNSWNPEVDQGAAWSAFLTAIDLYGNEGSATTPLTGTAPNWIFPSALPNGSFEMPARGNPNNAAGWSPTTVGGTSAVVRADAGHGPVWDGSYAMQFTVTGGAGTGNQASLQSSRVSLASAPTTLGDPDHVATSWILTCNLKGSVATTTGFNILAFYYDANGTFLASEFLAQNQAIPTAWTNFGYTLGSISGIPSGTQQADFELFVKEPNVTVTASLDGARLDRSIQSFQLGNKVVKNNNLNSGAVSPSTTDLGLPLLMNGSMELPNTAGTFPDGWTPTGTCAWVYDSSGTLTGDGTYSVQIGLALGKSSLESPKVAWTSAATGLRYGLRVRWRVSSSLNAAKDTWTVQLVSYDKNGSQLALTTLADEFSLGFPTLAAWTQYQAVTSSVPVATKYVTILFSANLGSGGTARSIYVDSVEVMDATMPWPSSQFELRSPVGALLSRYTGGNALPSGALANDRALRTDLNSDAIYDGTRWLGTEYEKEWKFYVGAQVGVYITAAPQEYQMTKLRQDFALRLVRWEFFGYVNGTNDGFNYWQVTLRTFTGLVTLSQFDTSSWTAATWTEPGAIAPLGQPATTDYGMQIYITKVGNPGGLQFYHGLWVRNVIT